MWVYEKKLQYPVRVSKCDPLMAKFLLEQYGGADGELAAALRYLNQRYSIPDKIIGLLTDIGTEEFAHLEMIATMVYKLTKDATPEQMRAAGLGDHYSVMIMLCSIRTLQEYHGLRHIFRRKGIRLRISTRTLPLRKRREQPING